MAIFALTLVRHGETNCNRQSITQGQQDTELSEQGIRQAQLVGQRLQDENFTHVFSSDLQRAKMTCEIIMKENNSTCPAQIQLDKRLRERKFGIFEGHPSMDLLKAANKVKSSISSYTPEGGEASKEVRLRAQEFFEEMCRGLQQQMVMDRDNNCLELPASIKRRRHTSNSTVDQVFPDSPPIDNLPPVSTSSLPHTASSSSSSSSSSSGCSSAADLESPSLSISGNMSAPTASSHHHHNTETSLLSPSSLDLQHNVFPQQHMLSTNRTLSQPIPFDLEIKTSIGAGIPSGGIGVGGGCPNVSLSPIFEHRPSTTMSSVSSGRNSSFDDGDMIPMPFANILIVAHGGLLRELINYFVDVLGCKIPGGKGYCQTVSPNTGISKFTVTLNEGSNSSSNDDPPRLTCLTIYDKDHLQPISYVHGDTSTAKLATATFNPPPATAQEAAALHH